MFKIQHYICLDRLVCNQWPAYFKRYVDKSEVDSNADRLLLLYNNGSKLLQIQVQVQMCKKKSLYLWPHLLFTNLRLWGDRCLLVGPCWRGSWSRGVWPSCSLIAADVSQATSLARRTLLHWWGTIGRWTSPTSATATHRRWHPWVGSEAVKLTWEGRKNMSNSIKVWL